MCVGGGGGGSRLFLAPLLGLFLAPRGQARLPDSPHATPGEGMHELEEQAKGFQGKWVRPSTLDWWEESDLVLGPLHQQSTRVIPFFHWCYF